MARRFCGSLGCMIALAFMLALGPLVSSTFAQEDAEAYLQLRDSVRNGGYLSLLKVGLVAISFLVWVKFADWINVDSMRFGKKSGLQPEIWNPILVSSFLVAFLAVITIPWFWPTFPVFVIATFMPPVCYLVMRRKRIKENASLARAIAKGSGNEADVEEEILPQDEGAIVNFSAAGADKNQQQANLIRARQSPEFAELKNLLFDCQFKRADQLMLDFSQTAVQSRMLVDGMWHALPVMDRARGDALLASLKCLAGVNPAERRARQAGAFSIKTENGKQQLEFSSQGVPTGERAMVRFVSGAQEAMPLDQLGMFPDMLQKVQSSMNNPGITIISSPPGQGFTSSWQGALLSADRLTRDCIGLILPSELETRIENIMPKEYDPANGKPQLETLRGYLLAQPDMLVVPKVEDKETMDLLATQANEQQRAVLLKTPARTAAEGLLRVYAQAGDRAEFLKALRVVTGQRLLRRLCPTCRVEVRVQPKLIQQLGGNPRTQGTLFNQYQLPPPEQRVDQDGKPIEFPPCETCGGIGYIGRIAVYEMIELTDPLREFIKKNPKPDAVEQAAVKLGKKSLSAQTYQLVLLGVTSLAEAQRVLQAKV